MIADLPPGPHWTRTRQTVAWVRRPLPFLEQCWHSYGDVFLLQLHALGDTVILVHPDDVERAFRLEPIGVAGEANRVMEPLLGCESLFVLDDAAHKERRRQLVPTVMSRHIERDPEAVLDAVDQVLSTRTTISIAPSMRDVALLVIGRRLLGATHLGELDKFRRALAVITGPVGSFVAFFPSVQRDLGPLSLGGWLRRRLQFADAALLELSDEALTGCPDSAAAHLHRIRNSGQPESLRDDLVTLLVAGMDTTASAMAWTIFWIARTPEVLARLQSKAEGIPVNAEPSDILGCEYLHLVCLEALRISPVVENVLRKLRSPIELRDYALPAGTLVSPAPFLAHRRPDRFPSPNEFRPGRFEHKYSTSEFFPFGGGVRRCIGAGFALTMIRLVVGHVISQFQITPSRPADREPRSVRRNVTVAPSDRLRIDLLPRLQHQ